MNTIEKTMDTKEKKIEEPSKTKHLFTSNSLFNRIFFASFIILPIFILLSGSLLLNTFQHSQMKAEQEKLQAQLYLLLGVTEIESGKPSLPNQLTEPRLNQQNSGLYAFIANNKHQELWRSASAELLPALLPRLNNSFTLNQRLFSQLSIADTDSQLNILSFDTEWIDENDNNQAFRFIIISDASPLIAEIKSYRSRLWQWLGSMGIALILAQAIIMLWGLRPLKHLSQQLHQLQKSTITQLDDNYPIEIQPVINNFNRILNQEKQQRERYRNTMSDLAHSLKTPLAVIQSQLSEQPNKDHIIDDQVSRINQIIAHQLQRAVIRINQSSINHNTNKIYIKKVVARLLKIMSKVYQERNISFSNLSDADSVFFGDEADLLEILGNLIDNACKHGHRAVTITAENAQDYLTIGISDDGKGIDQKISQTILQRGARADTVQPGQGLGLSVVVDIISSYGGEISVTNNAVEPHLSGAFFCVKFKQPAA
ncbi:MAG: two-component system sensor histidine kinase PhoQ [Candidatus Endobugula sp.]|jgi:two-component system sensor histidine kinase PhoQ